MEFFFLGGREFGADSFPHCAEFGLSDAASALLAVAQNAHHPLVLFWSEVQFPFNSMEKLRPAKALLDNRRVRGWRVRHLLNQHDPCDQSGAEDDQRGQNDQNDFPDAHQAGSASLTEARTVSSKSAG